MGKCCVLFVDKTSPTVKVLKKHIIKNHEDADLEKAGIETGMVIGETLKRKKQD